VQKSRDLRQVFVCAFRLLLQADAGTAHLCSRATSSLSIHTPVSSGPPVPRRVSVVTLPQCVWVHVVPVTF
jgi:hypothetical protein